jgi:threonylcarbamoyladenosine tRNA methylthiotransferase MtaB
MEQLLKEAGYEIVPFEPGADVYVINTCTVTNIADRKSRQMLHRARKMNPEAIVVAAGCYVQASGEEAASDDAIDIVIGNNRKNELVEAIRLFEETRSGAVDITDLSHGSEYESTFLASTQEHTRAYLKVQDGCNQFCSYCIIPYARGRVRSRKLEEVVSEVQSLAENGCREIVLTGIHLSSYGVDTGSSLLELIRTVHEIDGIERIRLGSLEPGIVTEEFAASLAALPKVCPHFHLSLQSGCDATLKRMNRKYTSGEYTEKCRILRKAFTRPALTTDVIVGFPAETEEEFETTVRFLEEISFYETHIFKYSRRKGTRAAAMPQQIPEQEKAVRSERLIALGDENRRRFEQSWQGQRAEVLMEETMTLDGKTYFTGYTKEYIKTVIPADADYTNCVVTGRIDEEVAPHIYRLLDISPVTGRKNCEN